MADGMATWHTYLGYLHNSTLYSICQTSTKCQFLIAVFLPLGKLFLCLLVSCVGVCVGRCGHMSPPDPDLASSGPRLGVATLKDPGTKVKDFH